MLIREISTRIMMHLTYKPIPTNLLILWWGLLLLKIALLFSTFTCQHFSNMLLILLVNAE